MLAELRGEEQISAVTRTCIKVIISGQQCDSVMRIKTFVPAGLREEAQTAAATRIFIVMMSVCQLVRQSSSPALTREKPLCSRGKATESTSLSCPGPPLLRSKEQASTFSIFACGADRISIHLCRGQNFVSFFAMKSQDFRADPTYTT